MDRGAVEMMEPSGPRLARRRLIVKGYQALVSYGPGPMLSRRLLSAVRSARRQARAG